MPTDGSNIQQGGELRGMLDDLSLSEAEKRFVRARWLDQMTWFESRAKLNQKRYYYLRLVGIVGGLAVPALVSLNTHNSISGFSVAWLTFALSLMVAISVSVDSFFNYGGRWREYRRTAELLKSHGWQFYELIGPYGHHRTHSAAFGQFATAVEALISADVQDYLTKVAGAQAQSSSATSSPTDSNTSQTSTDQGL